MILKSILESHKKIKLIIGGGGLLKDSFEEFWRTVLLSGAKYVCFGIGVCDIKGQNSLLPDDIFREVITKAERLWVRDSRTSMLIEKKFGLKVQSVLCPSVLYIHKKYSESDYKKKQRNSPVLLYTHHKKLVRSLNKGDDFIRNIIKQICNNEGFIFSEVDNITGNANKLLKQYADADFIINTRLHGCVFSYALDKPFVAISADTKIDSFVHDYCNATVLDMEHLTTEKLAKAIQQRMNSSPRKSDFQQNIEEIKRAGNLIKTFLVDSG
jgi:polysaccharide pyruvyl transferase WcaK-like protein